MIGPSNLAKSISYSDISKSTLATLISLSLFMHFRTFRRLLLGLMVLASLVTTSLAINLRNDFIHPSNPWMVVAVMYIAAALTMLSLVRKAAFGSPQKVAHEAVGFFVLCPFMLILTLYVVSITVKPVHAILRLFTVLQGFVIATSLLHFTYTAGLLVTTMLTVCAFDRDVWSRDIDSSPSPFPMAILFGFVCPVSFRTFASLAPNSANLGTGGHSDLCLPGCNCPNVKPPLPEPEMRATASGSGQSSIPTMASNRLSTSSASPSARSLVRLPTDAERRRSIVVAFEVSLEHVNHI